MFTDTFHFLILWRKFKWEKIKFRLFSTLFVKPTFHIESSNITSFGPWMFCFCNSLWRKPKKALNPVTIWEDFFFLTVVLLPHSTLSAVIIKGQSHSPDVNHCVSHIWCHDLTERHRETRTRLGSPYARPST